VQQRMALPATQLFHELVEKMRRFSVDGKFKDDGCLIGVEISAVKIT